MVYTAVSDKVNVKVSHRGYQVSLQVFLEGVKTRWQVSPTEFSTRGLGAGSGLQILTGHPRTGVPVVAPMWHLSTVLYYSPRPELEIST